MKTLYNTIQESLLSDIDTTLARGAYDIMLNNLFSTNLQQRRDAFNDLRILVESYRPKRHMTTAKMKSSDSYFVQFTRPLKIENGLAREICDYISYIQVCKRTGLDYRTVCINASEDRWGDKISAYELSWRHTQPNFNPKASNTKLYEVPEELNGLFERIQMEAYNHTHK
jgi:hypothetical protein